MAASDLAIVDLPDPEFPMIETRVFFMMLSVRGIRAKPEAVKPQPAIVVPRWPPS
jgi:hypothetical protein